MIIVELTLHRRECRPDSSALTTTTAAASRDRSAARLSWIWTTSGPWFHRLRPRSWPRSHVTRTPRVEGQTDPVQGETIPLTTELNETFGFMLHSIMQWTCIPLCCTNLQRAGKHGHHNFTSRDYFFKQFIALPNSNICQFYYNHYE